MTDNKIITLVMIHDRADGTTGPTTADVHPDEVANYESAGWAVAPTIDNWDPSAKLADIIIFAARLPDFDLSPALKKKIDIVAAIEDHLAAVAGTEADTDLASMDVQGLYEFAFNRNLDIDLGLEDPAAIRTAIEAELTASGE